MAQGWHFVGIFGTASLALVSGLIAALRGEAWAWIFAAGYLLYDAGLVLWYTWRARPAPTPALGLGDAVKTPSLAVLIAERDERQVLPATLAALAAQTQPAEQILVIDDGSRDGTAEWLREAGIPVLFKAHSGKADSLNQALALVSTELVLTLDADTVLAPDALAAIGREFAADPQLTAGCAMLTPQTGRGAAFWCGFQRLEYLRSFLWRTGWAASDSLVLVSGACAIYRRSALLAVGGFDPGSRVEDYEIMYRLHARVLENGQPLRARVITGAHAVTDVPVDLRSFLHQRRRWFAGFVQTLWRYRALVGNPAAGRLGRRHLVLKTIDLLLPVYGLAAWTVLLGLALGAGGMPWPVWATLGGKLSFDVATGLWCRQRYARIFATQPLPCGTIVALLLGEALLFQPLRQLAATAGWIAALRGRIAWIRRRS